MEYKKWGIAAIISILIALFIIGGITVVIDPYFHYHRPLNGLEYPIYEERYQSDGFLRHFDYDAIIIGSSMTSNFKTSELDALFDVNSVKASISAASHKELNHHLQRAFSANPNIKKVFLGVDGFRIMDQKDRDPFFENPEYLLDDSLLNDVQYIFNKQVLVTGSLRVLVHTLQGKKTTNFDEYGNFMEGKLFGKDALLQSYTRPERVTESVIFSDAMRKRTEDNLYGNIISLIQAHPDVEFYCFFPPVSIIYFDSVNQNGMLKAEFDAYQFASEQLLQQKNVHLFAFFDEYDIITNLDNYMDLSHYHEDINSLVLTWIKDGNHTLTNENYKQYWDTVYNYYSTYNYDALF